MMSRGKLKECFGEFNTTGFYVDFMQIFQSLSCPLQCPLLRPNISTRIFNPNDFACKQKEPIIVAEVGRGTFPLSVYLVLPVRVPTSFLVTPGSLSCFSHNKHMKLYDTQSGNFYCKSNDIGLQMGNLLRAASKFQGYPFLG